MNNMEKIKKYLRSINVEDHGNEKHIEISVMPYDDYRCREKIRVDMDDVLSLLKDKGIKHGKSLNSVNIQNKRRSSAVWIFENPTIEKVIPNKATQKTHTPRKNNSRKYKKNLDNSSEDVIIKETNNSE